MAPKKQAPKTLHIRCARQRHFKMRAHKLCSHKTSSGREKERNLDTFSSLLHKRNFHYKKRNFTRPKNQYSKNLAAMPVNNDGHSGAAFMTIGTYFIALKSNAFDNFPFVAERTFFHNVIDCGLEIHKTLVHHIHEYRELKRDTRTTYSRFTLRQNVKQRLLRKMRASSSSMCVLLTETRHTPYGRPREVAAHYSLMRFFLVELINLISEESRMETIYDKREARALLSDLEQIMNSIDFIKTRIEKKPYVRRAGHSLIY